jgi:hypothetical protein
MLSYRLVGRAFLLSLGIGLLAPGANAQQLIVKEEYRLMSGTMAPPGFHAVVSHPT